MNKAEGNSIKTGTKKSQKYKNKTGYKVKYKDDKINLQKNAILDRVCERCYEQLQWKLKYGKFKPIKQPKKCENCKMNSILKPYRSLCNKCGDELKKCTKCMEDSSYCKQSFKHVPKVVRLRMNALAENELKKFTLRCKKRIVRLWEDETIIFKNGEFCDKETGKPVEGIVFKKKFREEGDNGDGEDDEEDEDEYDDIDDELFGGFKPKFSESLKKEEIVENGNPGIKVSF